MSFDLAPALRAARNALILAALDGDGTPASVRFYNGVKPSPGGAVTTLQVTVPLDHPSATQAGSTLTFVPAEDGVRIDDKAITWCRFVDGSGDYVMDAAVSGPGGGAPVVISSTSGSIGSLVRLVSGTLTD
jgi:hypothetical protein